MTAVLAPISARPLLAPRGLGMLRGRVVVVKIGGAVIDDPAALASVAHDVALACALGARPLVVHGAGPQIDRTLRAFGATVSRVDGIRITDEAALEVVEMVLGGSVNQRVVAALAARGVRSVGLTGRDAGWIHARRVCAIERSSGEHVDPGLVGRPTFVQASLPLRLMDDGYVPVVAPLAQGAGGGTLNVNADTAAGAIAVAVRAHALAIYMDGEGVRDAAGHARSAIDREVLAILRADGTVHGGMLPKIDAASGAATGGVGRVLVLPPRPLALVERLLGHGTAGTELRM